MSPIIREIFDELDRQGVPYSAAGKRAGLGGPQLSQWKHGLRAPRLDDIEALVQACGFRLRLEKIPSHGPKTR
ncbi:helix-turn-helix domain-containing protein [Kaistia sp. MMO-174]|uniref:helix-turn-helix domain-containing protein n=1 Tax=Kaistia sp. MMO-174 TaxID=3081256 RepID=UPI00301B6A70